MNEITTQGGLLTFIERAARDPQFDVNKFSILLDRQEALIRQQQLSAFNTSYAAMQGEIKAAQRSGMNPIFRNPYAKLEDLDKAARTIYSKHGFSIRFGAEDHPKADWIYITLTLAHDGGHSEKSRLPGPMDMARQRTAIQAVGSTVTYLRRYLMQMVLNLVATNDPTDNDGNAITDTDVDPQTGEVLDPIEKATTPNKKPLTPDEMFAALQQVKTLKKLYAFWSDNKNAYRGFEDADKDRVGAEFERIANVFKEGGS
jgi:hypothetical protein